MREKKKRKLQNENRKLILLHIQIRINIVGVRIRINMLCVINSTTGISKPVCLIWRELCLPDQKKFIHMLTINKNFRSGIVWVHEFLRFKVI